MHWNQDSNWFVNSYEYERTALQVFRVRNCNRRPSFIVEILFEKSPKNLYLSLADTCCNFYSLLSICFTYVGTKWHLRENFDAIVDYVRFHTFSLAQPKALLTFPSTQFSDISPAHFLMQRSSFVIGWCKS